MNSYSFQEKYTSNLLGFFLLLIVFDVARSSIYINKILIKKMLLFFILYFLFDLFSFPLFIDSWRRRENPLKRCLKKVKTIFQLKLLLAFHCTDPSLYQITLISLKVTCFQWSLQKPFLFVLINATIRLFILNKIILSVFEI